MRVMLVLGVSKKLTSVSDSKSSSGKVASKDPLLLENVDSSVESPSKDWSVAVGDTQPPAPGCEDIEFEEQIIAIVSHKFSLRALRWATFEKECFGMYYTVKKCSYYLVGKRFTIETDHANLQWLENSETPKVVRWRVYIQGFNAGVMYIKGTSAKMALCDSLSRLFAIYGYFDPFPECQHDAEEDRILFIYSIFDADEPPSLEVIPDTEVSSAPVETAVPSTPVETEVTSMTPEQMFQAVHSGREGHWGVKTTWRRLNKRFPGHGLSLIEVDNCIKACVTCQKTRERFHQELIPVVRTLKPPHARSAIGIDEVTLTPVGSNGNKFVIGIVNLFTKHIALYPVSSVDATNLVQSVWKYWCEFRRTDMIVSDLGPALTSDFFNQLTTLAGVTHKFSIVDRHANGVER